MDPTAKKLFLNKAEIAAISAKHPFPEYAACEAALESNFGQSELAQLGNNLFGCKQHTHPVYPSVNLPTREFLSGNWVTVEAPFVKYPSFDESFIDRIATLRRLAQIYPDYGSALAAGTGDEFVIEVSKKWSTDPERAQKVLAIHKDFYDTPAVQATA